MMFLICVRYRCKPSLVNQPVSLKSNAYHTYTILNTPVHTRYPQPCLSPAVSTVSTACLYLMYLLCSITISMLDVMRYFNAYTGMALMAKESIGFWIGKWDRNMDNDMTYIGSRVGGETCTENVIPSNQDLTPTGPFAHFISLMRGPSLTSLYRCFIFLSWIVYGDAPFSYTLYISNVLWNEWYKENRYATIGYYML